MEEYNESSAKCARVLAKVCQCRGREAVVPGKEGAATDVGAFAQNAFSGKGICALVKDVERHCAALGGDKPIKDFALILCERLECLLYSMAMEEVTRCFSEQFGYYHEVLYGKKAEEYQGCDADTLAVLIYEVGNAEFVENVRVRYEKNGACQKDCGCTVLRAEEFRQFAEDCQFFHAGDSTTAAQG